MQYAGLALSLAWPQMLVAILWFGVALVALWYRRDTGRPIFLFGGIAALLISLSEVLSPLRTALRYFTHREYCTTTSACTLELQFGAAKYEWLLVGIAAFVFLVGIFLEIRRARRRAAANNAARAAAASKAALASASAGGAVSGDALAGQYQAASGGQAVARYDDALLDGSAGAFAGESAAVPSDEQPTYYRRPPGSSQGGPF
jgi:hypothetical protein